MIALYQSFKMAIKSIAGNKMRSFLTMLGIIIGVMALVILVSLVNGATNTVTDTISSLGSDLITVTVSDNKGAPIRMSTLDEFTENDAIDCIAPYTAESMVAKYGSDTESMTVYGATACYADINGLNLLVGRFLKTTDVDNTSNVCVINETTAEELVGYIDCLGEEISLNGYRFEIVGVLEDDDDSLTSLFGSGSYVAYIPYSTLVQVSTAATSEITSFYVGPNENYTVDEVDDIMTEMLMERFDQDDDAFSISSTNILEDAMSDVTGILSILLGGIAAISLIVGGIGIMNIMLVSVTERTREIGIRKAIGAGRGVILLQFLMEAVVLCMIGCLIGIFVSWGVLRIISLIVSSTALTFEMNGGVVAIAVAFCFLIGLCFGIYPANKAAKMLPIDALHYDG